MGLRLRSPLVVAASTLSGHLSRIRQAETAGAGAIVLRSLFAEQIQSSADELAMWMGEAAHVQEGLRPAPQPTVPPGPEAYVEWTKRVRETASIPVIASLNASSLGAWTEFAARLEECGIDGLELNVYRVPTKLEETSEEIEEELVEIVRHVCNAVSVPVAVKLAPYYTAPANLCRRLVEVGAGGLVLFNRFFQPDIDVTNERISSELVFSARGELRLPLRWIALLSDRVGADFALSTGIHNALDVVKAILAGADVVQVASALYRHGVEHLRTLRDGLAGWMEEKGYNSLSDFRGKLSALRCGATEDLERAHYVKLILAQT